MRVPPSSVRLVRRLRSLPPASLRFPLSLPAGAVRSLALGCALCAPPSRLWGHAMPSGCPFLLSYLGHLGQINPRGPHGDRTQVLTVKAAHYSLQEIKRRIIIKRRRRRKVTSQLTFVIGSLHYQCVSIKGHHNRPAGSTRWRLPSHLLTFSSLHPPDAFRWF